MKKILLILLIFTLCLVGCQPAEPPAENDSPDAVALLHEGQEAAATNPDAVYPKIHFYFLDNHHKTIDNAEELSEATAWLSDNQKENEVEISVWFASDFSSQHDFGSERANLKSIEDVREFRKNLNTASKEYHDELVEQNMGLLADFKYNSVSHIDYSPSVIMYINANEITMEKLEALSSSDAVTSICLSFVPEEVTAD